MAMETTQVIVYMECDLTQFILTQKEHDRAPCLDSFALCENRSGNRSLRLLWLKFITVHCYQSCFKNPHFFHTRLIMDLMRSSVNHWSPLTHTSHYMTIWVARWLSGGASDLRSSSRGFEPRPRRCCATTLGKLFTPYCLCHQAV